jgi:alkanesulfonate monooxygenase SsuD/methylene tetrahydromethanopterin reductase-like flavin-dependent oxidoreductase (luciferase family)
MEFGMLTSFPAAGAQRARGFDEAMARVDAAELGPDAMWLAERSISRPSAPTRRRLATPRDAARTCRMKIGIAVQVLPLCHPLRPAEEAATVDQTCRGY